MGGVGEDMNWFEAIIIGIVSGLAEFLPVSSAAHQRIFMQIFGCEEAGNLLKLFVHVGIILALFVSSGGFMQKLYKEYQLSNKIRRRRNRVVNFQSVLDIRFVKTAVVPLLIGYIFYIKTMNWVSSIPIVALCLMLNGLILYIPMYLPRGNKDSRNMSALDGILFGIFSAVSVLPGVSRIGAGCSAAIARGAAPQEAYKWSLLLSIPALIILICFDLYAVFFGEMSGMDVTMMLKCLLSGVFAYLGASLSIHLLKSLTVRSGFSGFSYYSWGAALFAFILYLY